MSNTNRVNRVFIGSGANTGVGTLPLLNVGDLFIYDSKNNLIDTVLKAQGLAKSEVISIGTAGGRNGNVLLQPIIGSKISHYEGQPYVASKELSILIGDPQVDGIKVEDGAEYRLRVMIKDDQRTQGQRPTLIDANYPASTNVTQEIVAAYIFCIFNAKEFGLNYASDKITLERVADGTFAALAAATTVITGSKTVLSAGHGVTVGAKVSLKLGGATDYDAVYIATAIDANTLELDNAYVGESGVIAIGDALVATDTAKWGFKVSGIPQESYINRSANEPFDEYEWMNFDATFSKAEDRALQSVSDKRILTALNPGQGYWKQVQVREEHAKANWGDTSKRRVFDKRINSTVGVGVEYDSIVITHVNEHIGDFQGVYNPPLKTEIYIPVTTDQGDDTTDGEFLTILNAYLVDVLGFKAIVF